MSIRIYALAKQLKVESKVLFDVCKKLGIEGKASALASLTEEEAEQVKIGFQSETQSAKTPTSAEASVGPLQRPSTSPLTGKIRVLTSGKAAKPKTEVAEEDIPLKDEQPLAQPSAAVSQPSDAFPATAETDGSADSSTPIAEKTESPEPGEAPPPPEQPIRSSFARPPIRSIVDSKIPTLDSKRKPPIDTSAREGGSRTGGPASKPGAPAIRLAPLPKPALKPTKSANEPAPQKPDLKLPKEAIRAAAMGTSRPLDEHIRKHEEKRLFGQDKTGKGAPKKKGKEPDASPTLSEEELKKRGGKKIRGRDGKIIETTEEAARVSKWKAKPGGANRKFREAADGEDGGYIPRQLRRQRRGSHVTSTAVPRKSDLVVQLPCTVKQYAEMTGLSVANVIRKLMEFGTPMMINSHLDKETADLLAVEFGLKVDVREEVSLEDRLVNTLYEREDSEDELQPRPPVVTVLGHVDHGKTSLLDRILKLDVVSGEKGGITQHIRAYRIATEHGDITFVDTPGHEAFTEMRARGANCTDIAVLVVAADDGVMPQTEEAISHAKAAGVPIVVALNKMDLPGANPDRAIQGLAANELLPSEWGGDVEIVRCSALTGMGMDELMQTLLTVAELHELKANPNRPATGVVLEAELQAGQGVVCKALVQNGTLRPGDVVLCGGAYGRVKAMYDTLDSKKTIEEATPSTPVNLVGLDVAPVAGSQFCVLEDISQARQIAETRADEIRKRDLAEVQSHVTLENLFQRINQANAVQTLNIIIRADVRGSIEAIRKELGKLDHPEVKIKILLATVGGITEADVQLADASDAIIVGFNVVPDENARALADKKKIQIRRYDIIYNLSNDIRAALEGMLKPLEQVKELGRALVQRVYSISRLGTIAGCRVLSGNIERDSKIRIIRDSRIIGEYNLDSLRREKDDAKDVREGYECGMKLKGFNDLKEGDILEAYKIEEIARTF